MSQKRRRRKLTEIKAAYLKRGDIYNRRGELDIAQAAFFKYLTNSLLLDSSCKSTYKVWNCLKRNK